MKSIYEPPGSNGLLEQVSIKLKDGGTTVADFVAVGENKVIGIFESKVDESKLSQGQSGFFNEKLNGTLTGKNAGSFKGTEISPSAERTVYRWNSNQGSYSMQ